MYPQLEAISVGDHIIAIYDNKDAKLDDAFDFLRQGIDGNEVSMLITEDVTRKQALERMKQEWTGVDVDALEASGTIVIKTTSEWYFPKGAAPNKSRIVALWTALAELATIRGKKGLRVVGDVNSFFVHGYGLDLAHYECDLMPQFDIPVTALCQYEKQDIYGKLPAQMAQRVKEHHKLALE